MEQLHDLDIGILGMLVAVYIMQLTMIVLIYLDFISSITNIKYSYCSYHSEQCWY